MAKIDFKCTDITAFVQGNGSVKARRNNVGTEEKYFTTFNGFRQCHLFTKNLKYQLGRLDFELQNLPLYYPKRKSRVDYLTVLYEVSINANEKLKELGSTNFLHNRFSFRCSNMGAKEFKRGFPKTYKSQLHPSRFDYENHKIHRMFEVQQRVAIKTIKQIGFYKKSLTSAGRMLGSQRCSLENMNTEISEKVITSLSVSQLAYLFGILTDAITDKKPNKKELAKILSKVFETPRASQPSVNQLYKSFYDVEDSTREVVKSKLIEMLNKVKN